MALSNNYVVCLNNQFINEKDAMVSVQDRGFVYGDGLFTTMRAEKGTIFFLDQHLDRLHESCLFFRIKFPAELKNKDLYKTMLETNKLQQGCAAVKIIITRGQTAELGLPTGKQPTWLVSAKEYTPPNQKQYEQGWCLSLFKHPRTTPMAKHKTLNYLYNLCARQYAIDTGANEALLIDSSNNITETATGTILVRFKNRWLTPKASGSLPGITLRMLRSLWEDQGRLIDESNITLKKLQTAHEVWTLNSLMGIMPVARINNHELPECPPQLAHHSRESLWLLAKDIP